MLDALQQENLEAIHFSLEYMVDATDDVRDRVFVLQGDEIRLHSTLIPSRDGLEALWQRLKDKHKNLRSVSISINGSRDENDLAIHEHILGFNVYASTGPGDDHHYDIRGIAKEYGLYEISSDVHAYYHVNQCSVKILYDDIIDQLSREALLPPVEEAGGEQHPVADVVPPANERLE